MCRRCRLFRSIAFGLLSAGHSFLRLYYFLLSVINERLGRRLTLASCNQGSPLFSYIRDLSTSPTSHRAIFICIRRYAQLVGLY